MTEIEAGLYRHYKGALYQVVGTARHSESDERLVVYRPLYGDYALWVRPAAMFAEELIVDGEATPRFRFLGAQHIARSLESDAFDRARAWLTSSARALEQARFAYHFDGARVDTVLDALAPFQNSDGGFGHALEPDLQTPASSVLATTVALQTLRELEISGEHRLVRGAMSFLAATYCADQQGWPFVPAAAENAPHAPWWNGVGLATQLSRFHGNPRAEVIAYLYQYPGYLEEDVRDALATAVLEHLDTLLPDVEMHTFLCYQRLVETDALPDRFRRPLLRALKEAAHAIVARDPSRWHGYVVQPISMAATPQSPFADLFRNELPLNLDMLIGQQSAEGGWEPAWSWGDAYPESWPAAKQAWTGMLTVNTLRTLRAYGRL